MKNFLVCGLSVVAIIGLTMLLGRMTVDQAIYACLLWTGIVLSLLIMCTAPLCIIFSIFLLGILAKNRIEIMTIVGLLIFIPVVLWLWLMMVLSPTSGGWYTLGFRPWDYLHPGWPLFVNTKNNLTTAGLYYNWMYPLLFFCAYLGVRIFHAMSFVGRTRARTR